MRQGQVATLEAESIVGIGAALIKARIVRNLTQRELAERLQQVADALNLHERAVLASFAQDDGIEEIIRALPTPPPRRRCM